MRLRYLALLLASLVLFGAAGNAFASDRVVLGELFTAAG
jgi:hypothetical protein